MGYDAMWDTDYGALQRWALRFALAVSNHLYDCVMAGTDDQQEASSYLAVL